MLKAQVNILELEQPDTKAEAASKMSEKDAESELQSLKKVVAEQNRVQQDFDVKVHQMKQLLNQELEKNQFLERQLTENYKKVRMLNSGSANLDHILSVGQSPKINWGLGYKGATLQDDDYGKAEGINFIKAAAVSDDRPKATVQQVNNLKAEEKSGVVTETKGNRNITHGNGCLFNGKQGHCGTSSHMVDKNEKIKYVRSSIPVVSAEQKDETQASTVAAKIQGRKVGAKRRNGCHFCGKIGHSVAYCYARRNQLERAWRLNLCFIEPKKCGHVWIAKHDLYPKFRRETRQELHLETDVSHKRAAEHVEEILCNFAHIQVEEPEIKYQAIHELHANNGLSHVDREEHAKENVYNLSQNCLEKKEKLIGEKATSCHGSQDVTHTDEDVTHPSTSGSLLHLTPKRSDLGLTIDTCIPFQDTSRLSHPCLVKQISNDVKGILKLKLHYSFDTNMMMAGVCDVNRRCSLAENNLKLCHNASQLIDYGIPFDPPKVHCNNLNVICVTMNPVKLSLTEKVDIKHHLVSELFEEKLGVIEHVASEIKLADIVTKLPEFNSFLCMRKALGISDL